MKKILAVLLTITLLLPCMALAGDTPVFGSSSDATVSDPSLVIGVWTGQVYGNLTTFTFNSDYTFTLEMKNYGGYDGTYTLEGDQLTMNGSSVPITVTVTGNTFDADGILFTKQEGVAEPATSSSESSPESVVGIWKCTNTDEVVEYILIYINISDSTMTADITLELKSDSTYALLMSMSYMGCGVNQQVSTGWYTYSNGALTLDGEISAVVKDNSFTISDSSMAGLSLIFVKE